MTIESSVTIKKSVCSPCHSNCGVLVHIKDGRVIKIEGDPDHPENEGSMCVRGQSFTQLLYHQDRIKYPMKRVGEKGEGKWERISWDEALDTIALKMKEAKEKYGPDYRAVPSPISHLNKIKGYTGLMGFIPFRVRVYTKFI